MTAMLLIVAMLLQNTDTATVRLVLAVLCVMVLSSIAVGVSIGLARRMHDLAERTPRTDAPPPAAEAHDDQVPD